MLEGTFRAQLADHAFYREHLSELSPSEEKEARSYYPFLYGTDSFGKEIMNLGNFSISLAVKDIEASKLFYEKLGFPVFGGDQSQNWLIMNNGVYAIGLFQGMFDDSTTGPASLMIADPDGNTILADQHV